MNKTFILMVMIGVAWLISFGGTPCSAKADEKSHIASTKKDERNQAEKENIEDQRLKKAIESARAAKKIIVAKVNGAPITMYELVRKMNVMAPKFLKPGERPDANTTEKIKKAALDTLIFEELAVQEAKKQGIKPPPGKVENILTNIRMSLGPEENYKKFLQRLDLTEDQYIDVIVRGQLLDMILQKEIYDKVKVDEKELHRLYEKEKDKLILPERYEVTDVAFLGKSKDIKKKAEKVVEQIKENGNDPWKLVQDGTFIVRTYWVKKSRNPALYKAMKKMKVGELSDVIEDRDGYHIIKVEKKDDSRVATLEEARKYLEKKLKGPQYQKRKKEWEDELKKNAKIEIYWDRIEKGMQDTNKAS